MPRLRVRVPATGAGTAMTIMVDRKTHRRTDVLPCKEWSITDDVLNISDCASVSIANDDGENSGKFHVGQRIEIDVNNDDDGDGQWLRQFTGRITALESYTDVHSGSNILITAMDLGWHLTSCNAEPHKMSLKGITFQKLIAMLVDKTWKFGGIVAHNDFNRKLKLGRQLILQNHKPVLGAILPFIQVEPGQSPIELLKTYAAREGFLINISADGGIVLFRPRYDLPASYKVEFHPSTDDRRRLNNLIGRPTLKETIDGIYSQVDCWSTVVIPPEILNTEDPNEGYVSSSYKPKHNPLPFFRRHVFTDTEAVTEELRMQHARWKYQMDAFNSWSYEVEFNSHSQNRAMFVSDTMISVDDTVNKVGPGLYYVQSVQRSQSLRAGTRTKLMIRKPNLLNPKLDAI